MVSEQQGSGQQGVRIDTLPTADLDYVGKQLDREFARLQQSAQYLSKVANEFQLSRNAIHELKTLEDGAHATLHCAIAASLCANRGALCAQRQPGTVVHLWIMRSQQSTVVCFHARHMSGECQFVCRCCDDGASSRVSLCARASA